jgi:hypothetical protein
MQTIRNQVQKAWRRLWLQNFVSAFGWALLACFSACFIALLLPKLVYLPYTFASWSRIWMIGSGVAAIVASLLYASWKRPTELRAAIELDRRFDLRERASSALALPKEDRESAAGIALLQDAQNKLERIDIRDEFPVRPAPQLAWTMLPLAACIALFWVADASLPDGVSLPKSASENIVNVKNSTAPLLTAVQKKREEAESLGDQESAEQFKKLEEKIRDLQNNSEADQKKVIADLNEIKKGLQQKRDALGNADQMKKTMESLKELDKGPAEKMVKALQEGDIDQAEKELSKMLDALKSDNLDEQQSKQLQKQLEQMQKAMSDAQNKREQLKQDTQRELDKAEKEGNTEKIANLRKKLEQMEKSESQCKAGEKLAQQMAKAQKALQEGNKEGAAEALEEMQGQLEEMLQDEAASDELQEMLDQLEDAKNASKCDECKGAGCKACNVTGKKDQ